MPMTFTVSGDQQVLDASLDSFVRHHGWVEENEATKLEYARKVLAKFLRESIAAYDVVKAQSDAAIIKKAEVEATLEGVTSTIAVEE